jgi:hypothetical protein
LNQITQLLNGNPVGRVEFKDTPQDGVELGGKREDCPQKPRILHISTESAVLKGSPFPGVAATG